MEKQKKKQKPLLIYSTKTALANARGVSYNTIRRSVIDGRVTEVTIENTNKKKKKAGYIMTCDLEYRTY